MKITPAITAALRRAINYYGNVSQLASAIGVAHSTVLFWVNGKTTDMSGKLWTGKIRPVLAPFLSQEHFQEMGLVSYQPPRPSGSYMVFQENPVMPYVPGLRDGYEANNDTQQHGAEANNNTQQQQTNYVRKPVPVVPFSALSKLDPTIDPIQHFLKENRTGKTCFSQEVRNGSFGVRMGKEYETLFHQGTDLLISTEDYPEYHNFVLARIRETGDVVIRRYEREGDMISLISPVEGGKDYSWNCSDSLGFLLWWYPVMEAVLNLRQDSSQQDAGHKSQKKPVQD